MIQAAEIVSSCSESGISNKYDLRPGPGIYIPTHAQCMPTQHKAVYVQIYMSHCMIAEG